MQLQGRVRCWAAVCPTEARGSTGEEQLVLQSWLHTLLGKMFQVVLPHRIIERFGLKGTSEGHAVQLPCSEQTSSTRSGCFHPHGFEQPGPGPWQAGWTQMNLWSFATQTILWFYVLQPCTAGTHRVLRLLHILKQVCLKVQPVCHGLMQKLFQSSILAWNFFHGAVPQCWCFVSIVNHLAWKAWPLRGSHQEAHTWGCLACSFSPTLQPHAAWSTALVLESFKEALAHTSTSPVCWWCHTGKAFKDKPPADLPWDFGSYATLCPLCQENTWPKLTSLIITLALNSNW